MGIEFKDETIKYLERLVKRGGHDGEQAREVLKSAGLYKYDDDETRDDDGRFAGGSEHQDATWHYGRAAGLTA
jgi:hypothetical protein